MRVPLEMRAAFGSGGTAVLTGYRWGALGIGLKSASETNGTMEMILHNVSSSPVAVVLPEDQRTLRLRETPGMDVSEPRIPVLILAREITLEELELISNTVDIEKEIFIHGSLCICLTTDRKSVV